MNLLTQETINRYLELLGLTSQEILILTSILSSSSSLSTLELEKLTNLPKHQIYRALKKLINESLIEELNSSIPKKYLSQTSTIKKFLQSLEEKSNLEKENLSKSNKEDLSNIFMDEEQKLVHSLLFDDHLSRNELSEMLDFSYEKIRNITQKLSAKKYIESYKKGKIILYKSNSLEEIVKQRLISIDNALNEKKKILSNLVDFTSDTKSELSKSLLETKIKDHQITSKYLNKLDKNNPIYSSLFVAIDSSPSWKEFLNEELLRALELVADGYEIKWLVSEEILSFINDLDIDDINSLLKYYPKFSIKVYNRLIERIIIFNASEFYHFSFTPSFLDSAIYHNDSEITALKIREFNEAWESSHDIRPLILEVLKKQDLIDFITPGQQIESIQTFNLALMGDKGVGKTTLINRFLTGKFISNLRVTLGIKVDNLLVKLPDRLHQPASDIRVLVYDFGGQETFHKSYVSQIQDKNVFGLVFDLNNGNSFNNLEYWIHLILEHSIEDPKFILIGTKKDLEDNPVNPDRIWDLRKKYRLDSYYETSSLDGTNVTKVFESIAELFVKKKR
ncbi:MAG: helix-turn-helix domain-containing protein [Candidatus Hodarchaeales archaeon]